jgi:hypothetical protein
MPLNPAESIFAAFHDPQISATIPFRFEALGGEHCNHEFFWCWTVLRWERSAAGSPAGVLTLDVHLPLDRHNELIFCLTIPEQTAVQFDVCLDGKWQQLGAETVGTGYRMEIRRQVQGRMISALRACFRGFDSGPRIVYLIWFGIGEAELVSKLESSKPAWDEDWPGLIRPVAEWPEVKFARGLLFDATDLPGFRAKKKLADWAEQFVLLESKARDYLRRCPEDDCGDYLPWADNRHIRQREKGRQPYFWEAQILGLVGLINEDRAMCRHALRYLMCLLHTSHWTQSGESRLRGSFWDQRCYLEEMASTTVSLLLDWFDFALTRRAKSLARTVLWDKGLAIIERDMMKHEFVHHTNQGPWFCRGRVFGGLMIEKGWPKANGYTDRMVSAMRSALNNYILKDGGTDEGMGYFSLTLHSILPPLIAYARQRKRNVKKLLPKHIGASETFFCSQCAVEPGRVTTDADNTGDHLVGDTVAIMAGMFPRSVYPKLLETCVAKRRPFSFCDQYMADGLFSFVFGPDQIHQSTKVVPQFELSRKAGYLTSFRESNGRSICLRLCGTKANASHTHYDKGNFTVEIDGVPVLIDRGIVRYDDIRAGLLKKSCMHNIITPVLDDGIHPDQAACEQAVTPKGRGDDRTLSAEIDLTHPWRKHMRSSRRGMAARSLERFEIADSGELQAAGRIALHLHSRSPFHIDGNTATVECEGKALEVKMNWASGVQQQEELVDFAFRPVFHLTATSEPVTKFSVVTEFIRTE